MSKRHEQGGSDKDLELLIAAGFPLLVVDSFEEARFLERIARIASANDWALHEWKVTRGLQRRPPLAASAVEAIPGTLEPPAVLDHLANRAGDGVFVLLDLHPYLGDARLARLLKDATQRPGRRTLIVFGHGIELPGDLKKLAAPFEFSAPDADELREILKDEVQQLRRERPDFDPVGDAEAIELVLQQLRGLAAADARRVLRQILIDDGALTRADLERVYRAKRDLLARAGVLSFETPTVALDDLAGLGNLKRWLLSRRAAFHAAADDGGDAPKGIMLLGVQGCGKSMAAKAVAVAWGVPLLRLDFATLYNKYLGETERNLRESLKTADAMSPCVLWIDEIEKGIATGSGDGGESQRVLGTLLTWMAERSSRVFLIATSNDIERLPPELVRKGRLDEIFFVDLPNVDERGQILAIHLKRRQQDPAGFDLAALAVATEGFSGAEIEQAVVAALYEAKAAGVPLATAQIESEAQRTRPLSIVMAEKIARLRIWASERTVPAT